MADDNFIGTTFSFGSAVAKLIGCSARENGGDVDVSASDLAVRLSADDVPDYEITARFRGNPDIHVGDAAAAISVAWQDGETSGAEAATWRVMSVETNGQQGSGLETSIVFKPATAPA